MEYSRRDYILKLIIEHFIKTAQPVSSLALIEAYQVEYSSATIRNEMNTLEKVGLLEKTHTSSGRVPSSEGYKYYIDHLRNRSVDERIKQQLQIVLSERTETVEQVMNKAGEILASMTDLVSVILGPKASNEHLVSLQLVPISKTSVTAIFVTDKGFVENKTFILSDELNADDLRKSMDIIESRLKGSRIDELVDKMANIKPILTDFIIEHEVIYRALMEAVKRFQDDRLYYYGEEKLRELPAFSGNHKRINETIKGLDNPNDEEIAISIAKDHEDITVLKAQIKTDDEVDGVIAIIGPKRMDYEKAVNSLEYLLKELKKNKKQVEKENVDGEKD